MAGGYLVKAFGLDEIFENLRTALGIDSVLS